MIYCKDFWVFWTWFIVAKMVAIQRLQSIKSIALDMDYNHFTIHPTSNVSDILVFVTISKLCWHFWNDGWRDLTSGKIQVSCYPQSSSCVTPQSLKPVKQRCETMGGMLEKNTNTCFTNKYGGIVLFDSETFWTRFFLWRFDFVIHHFRDTDCYCTALYLGATLNWFTDCYGYGPQTCWVFSSSFQVILRSLEGQQNVTCCYFFRIMARWKNEDFQTYDLLKEG